LKIIKDMGMDMNNFQMVINIKDTLFRIREAVKEFFMIIKVINIKDSLKIIFNMGMELNIL
jgi:hypothetical protein